MDTKFKALLALLATVILWSVHASISRAVVLEIPPMLLSLLRMGSAALLFLPFVVSTSPWRKKYFGKLVAVSFLSTINVLLFIWGVQYTSASTSQIIYSAIPILLVLINIFILKEKISAGKIAGVLLGFSGLVYIFFLSAIEKGETITGSLMGNLAILAAMVSWTCYIIFSKKLTKYFSPVEIGGTSVIVACIINFFLAIVEYWANQTLGVWNPSTFLGGLYMGIGGTFLAYIFYQYAIKYVSTLEVSLSSYLQPITTAMVASIFIGEKLTVHFLIGSVLVFSGIFLTTTLEVYKRRK